ncbi:hypothetical protein T05_11261 [Trichinella murrelli]|uniref:Uncharacterized protein n=1 Tax=Trichinella murrelli TaxID=144512 RepID=A0A0V0UHB2_9BILA|nr:hypothetical protein T05_11261 [Trichinella murrelli]
MKDYYVSGVIPRCSYLQADEFLRFTSYCLGKLSLQDRVLLIPPPPIFPTLPTLFTSHTYLYRETFVTVLVTTISEVDISIAY